MTDPVETLWIKDAEMIRRLGVPEKVMRSVIRELDRRASGFPRKQKLYGDRRYWPAVKAYFDSNYGLMMPQPKRTGERRYG